MIRLFSSISLLALGLATSATAQTAPAADQAATNVAEVVITATRTPTERLKVASSLTVITAKDIALKEQPTLADVLSQAPGLNIVQSGGPGGSSSVFMRGTNSNHVKVLIDGIDASDPSTPSGTFDFGQVLTPDIERVEILRGPQSGLYGSDAIGGVINIITKSGNGAPHATVGLEGGSFGTFNQNASVGGQAGQFHYAATVEHFSSSSTPVTPTDALAPGERRNNDSYDNLTASTKLGYDVTSNFDFGLVARYTDSKLHLTADEGFCPPADLFFGFCTVAFPDPVRSETDDKQYYLRGTGHLSLLDGKFDQTLGLTYSNDRTTDITPSGDSFTAPYDAALAYSRSNFYGNRVKIDWQGDIKLADTETLVIGAEHQRDEITQPLSAGTSTNSGYGELQSTLLPNLNDTIAIRYDSNSRFGSATTYRFAPTYYFASTGTKLEASVGTGFKAPTLSQLYQSFPAFGFVANPNLRPERSTGYDAGFEQYLLEKKLQFGATWFYNSITDLIEDNAFFTTNINIGKAHTEGVESFVLVQPVRTLSFRLDYTYTDAVDDVAHEELLRRPRNKWTFDTRWQAMDRLSLDASLLSVGPWIDGNREFTISRLKASGYTTVNLAANYDLTHQLTVYGRITNLLDKKYEDPDGFLKPSLGVFVGVKAKL